MKPGNVLRIFLALAAATILASCGSAKTPTPTDMTVTFTDKGCTYAGPGSVVSGNLTVKWIVTETKHTDSVLAAVTLAPDKTIQDLKAAQGQQTPSWVNILWIDHEHAEGYQLYQKRSYTYQHDLASVTNYNGEPIYLACGNEKGMVGVVGPIAVTK